MASNDSERVRLWKSLTPEEQTDTIKLLSEPSDTELEHICSIPDDVVEKLNNERDDLLDAAMEAEQKKIWDSLTPEEKALTETIVEEQRGLPWSEENDKYLSSLPENIKAILWFLLDDHI